MKNKSGFTLVEIMIVVGIIAALALIAIPNILSSRKVATEAAATANLRTLNTALQLYHINKDGYPGSLAILGADNYVDADLASGIKQGYDFIYNSSDSDHFTVNANSRNTGALKGEYYFIDESGIIRFNPDAPASAGDEAVK